MATEQQIGYEPARAIPAEGARVGLVACRTCGTALLLDVAVPFDVLERHTEWHRANGDLPSAPTVSTEDFA